MSSSNVGHTSEFNEIHVRECIVYHCDQTKKTITVMIRDGKEKGMLPVSDRLQSVILPGMLLKDTIVTVIFFRRLKSNNDTKWEVIWGNPIFPKSKS